jgi:hypothetical protein
VLAAATARKTLFLAVAVFCAFGKHNVTYLPSNRHRFSLDAPIELKFLQQFRDKFWSILQTDNIVLGNLKNSKKIRKKKNKKSFTCFEGFQRLFLIFPRLLYTSVLGEILCASIFCAHCSVVKFSEKDKIVCCSIG